MLLKKNDLENNKMRNWGPGEGSYNPYAVCSKTVPNGHNKECSKHIDYESLDLPTLRTQASLWGLDYNGTREELLNRIKQYKTLTDH